MPTVAPRLLLIAPAIVVFLFTTLIVGIVAPGSLGWIVGLAVGLVAAFVCMVALERRAPDAALRSLGAIPLADGAEPRLESLVDSICASHGISRPRLYVVESRAPDAAVAGNVADTRLVVTTGALRQLDRLELEAVIARELVQFGSGVHAATVLAAVFEKAAASDGVPDRAASRHLWLVGPHGVTGAVQPALGERIDTLREL